MKQFLVFSILSSLVLVGCATMMTPEQHQIFAKDWVTLDLCTQTGLISTDLAAEARHLYNFRLKNYKFDENKMNSHINSYNHQIRQNFSPATCNSYTAQVYGEILDRQRAQASVTQLNQTLNNLSGSFANSTYQQTQMNNQMNQYLMNMPQYQSQPIRQPQTTTNCMRVGNGMYNCQSQTR